MSDLYTREAPDTDELEYFNPCDRRSYYDDEDYYRRDEVRARNTNSLRAFGLESMADKDDKEVQNEIDIKREEELLLKRQHEASDLKFGLSALFGLLEDCRDRRMPLDSITELAKQARDSWTEMADELGKTRTLDGFSDKQVIELTLNYIREKNS